MELREKIIDLLVEFLKSEDEDGNVNPDKYATQILSAFKEAVKKEVIGSDSPYEHIEAVLVCNELRAVQNQRLDKLIGEKT